MNNYNAPVMLAWQANMDLQIVLNAHACVMHVASYIMKTDSKVYLIAIALSALVYFLRDIKTAIY